MSKKKIVAVLGIMGRIPFAGVAWQVLHYLEGLRRLGYDTYYVEDTGDWPYDPEQRTITDDCRYTVNYIARLMAWCGMSYHWVYRSGADGRTFGLSELRLSQLYKEADMLINVTGATVLKSEHLSVPARIFLETDPVLPQIEVAKDHQFTIDLLSAHTHHFTFGENLGETDCSVPLGRFDYYPTRQPTALDWWGSSSNQLAVGNKSPATTRYTTIASWQQSGKDVEWNGETYFWSKHLEFLKLIDLPRLAGQPMELALAPGDLKEKELFKGAIQQLEFHGWRVVDAIALSKDILPYRDYIVHSRGEFTVAKDQYVRPLSGWFSDRSACYLAACRPVITQETGFSKFLPTGKGLFAFKTIDDILAAVDAIESDYEGNCRAAREIAAEHFAAEKVIGSLLERAGL